MNRNGARLKISEHLIDHGSISQLESLMLYGVQDLAKEISRLRAEGRVIRKRRITFAEAILRVRKYAEFIPPKQLPIREIYLSDYVHFL